MKLFETSLYTFAVLLPVLIASFVSNNWDWHSYLTSEVYLGQRIMFVAWWILVSIFAIYVYCDSNSSDPYGHY